jgi:hypothetical protein
MAWNILESPEKMSENRGGPKVDLSEKPVNPRLFDRESLLIMGCRRKCFLSAAHERQKSITTNW